MTRARNSPTSGPKVDPALQAARTCYDHLAGRVAVQITHALVGRGIMSPRAREYDVPPSGERWFALQHIDVVLLRKRQRKLTRLCLDWTERQPHLGGALGAAWLTRCISAGWLTRRSDTRAVRITDRGNRALRDLLGLDLFPG
jgi:hypothetical protein